MWPKRPAFEPQSIVQIRPLAARLVAKMCFEKIAGANYFGSQLFKPQGSVMGPGNVLAIERCVARPEVKIRAAPFPGSYKIWILLP